MASRRSIEEHGSTVRTSFMEEVLEDVEGSMPSSPCHTAWCSGRKAQGGMLGGGGCSGRDAGGGAGGSGSADGQQCLLLICTPG